jgi:hypothetical protein
MNMLLSVLQVLLALAFFAHGNGEQRYSVQAGLSATTFESASEKDRAYSNRSRPLGFHTVFDSGRNRYRMNARASSACVALADTATAESIHAPSSAGSGPTSSISL